jgi:hypothetical protein
MVRAATLNDAVLSRVTGCEAPLGWRGQPVTMRVPARSLCSTQSRAALSTV